MFGHMGSTAKQITDRYVPYPSAPQTHETYSHSYVYEPAPTQYGTSHAVASKHSHHGSHKSNAAMSALTLLAFLFFLNILQQCLKDHMSSMNMPPIMIMTGGRDGEDVNLAKTADDVKKVDKSGQAKNPVGKTNAATGSSAASKAREPPGGKFTKIKLAHRENPRDDGFPGFVSAMTID